jgi:hypothetical protein
MFIDELVSKMTQVIQTPFPQAPPPSPNRFPTTLLLLTQPMTLGSSLKSILNFHYALHQEHSFKQSA